ncbi:MAG: hypothetical protein JNK37_17070 [Verrucomicrobiales bacterium]|nr:hypothetical protein [Verrucomicrobiales bacterium]
MTEFYILMGVVVLAFGLRSFDHAVLRKAGAVCVLVASYLAPYFLSGSHVAGVAGVLMWFLLPWIELLTRVRRLRLPLRKSLTHQTPPNAHRFPHLSDFTHEIETEGFTHVEDAGWEWEDLRQFFRIFYRAEERTQAAICLNEQHGMGFAFVSLTSRTLEGRIYRTWNFPFGQTLRTMPDVRLNQVPNVQSFEELLAEHRDFLERLGVATADLVEENPESIPELMEAETQLQIRHNIERGVIEHDTHDPEKVRYSWRGLFYVYGQLVKDMVKLS